MKKITCLNCSKKFIHYNKTSPTKYCSKKCFREKRNERKRLKRLANVKNIKINCKFCKKKFSKKSNSQKLHCSKRCVYKSQLKDIQNFLEEEGKTLVNINISNDSEQTKFRLKTLRNIDRKSINILRNKEISLNIN